MPEIGSADVSQTVILPQSKDAMFITVTINEGGEAAALDPKTGAIQTTLNLGAPAYIAPSAYNGALYVLTDSGQLICIR